MRVELKLHDQHGLKKFECIEVFYPTDGLVCFTCDGYIDSYFSKDVARVRTYLDDYTVSQLKEE